MILTSLLAASVISQAPPVAITQARAIVGMRATALAAAPAGSRFAVGAEDNFVNVYDASNRYLLRRLGPHPDTITALAWSPDGRFIASGDGTARVWLWDASSGKKLQEYRFQARQIQSLSFNQNGTRLLSTSQDATMNLFDTGSNRRVGVIPGNAFNFYGGRFTPDGAIIVATLEHGVRRFATDGRMVATIGPANFLCMDVAINRANSRVVAGGTQGLVLVADPKSNQSLGQLRGHEEMVVSVAIAPNGRVAATGSVDRTVKIWDISNPRLIRTIEDQSGLGSRVAFTGDGRFLITQNGAEFVEIHALNPALAAPAPAQPAPRRPAPRRPR